jgi:hypothetical protein
MDYLFEKYPAHLSLDVSTDNTRAVQFYKRVGLEIEDVYLSEEKVEFAKFATPKGFVPPPKRANDAHNTTEEVKKGDPKGGCSEEKKQESSDDDTLVSESELAENASNIIMNK